MNNLLLHPLALWPTEESLPYEVGLVDPFVAYNSSDIDTLHADPARVIIGRIACLTSDSVRGLRKTAVRGNWLTLEQTIEQVLVDLLWAALLMPESKAYEGFNGEKLLENFLKQPGLPLLEATAISRLCDCTLDLVARALPLLHQQTPDIKVESEDWFWWAYNSRHDPVPRENIDAYEQVAQRIADSLALMPVFRGLLIVGSFAEADKHDGFNDLDLYCYCSELPTKQMRQGFFARLGLANQGSEIAFEYLQLDGVNVHLSLPLVSNQQTAIERLVSTGDESDCGQFLNPNFAASAYHLARGHILRDPTGLLAAWQEQVTQYPLALHKRIYQIWRPVWERFAPRVRQALTAGDRIHALIAMRYCREAYLRILLANQGVLCDPNGLKWLLHEACRLPASQQDALLPAIESARFDGVPTLVEQFTRLNALWPALLP